MGHLPGELSKGRVQRLHLWTFPLLHLLGGHRARLTAQQTKHGRADFSTPTKMNLTNQQMAHLAIRKGAACTSIGWVTVDNSCNNPMPFLTLLQNWVKITCQLQWDVASWPVINVLWAEKTGPLTEWTWAEALLWHCEPCQLTIQGLFLSEWTK